MEKVSVIVPSYNLGRYLGETLESVRVQTFPGWECIVVDNGSSDNSLSVARSYAEKDPRFCLIALSENEGVSAARNRGLSAAAGEYVLFLDADDLLSPDYLAQAVAALDADPSLSLVYGRAVYYPSGKAWDLPPFSMDTMLARNCMYISCLFRKKDAVEFDPAFRIGFEDWDFWLSYLERLESPKVLQLPSVCFFYRSRRHSRNRGVTDEALVPIRRLLWEKHKALYASYFCDPLQTVEYRRMASSFRKASRWSLAWKLRMLFRKCFA